MFPATSVMAVDSESSASPAVLCTAKLISKLEPMISVTCVKAIGPLGPVNEMLEASTPTTGSEKLTCCIDQGAYAMPPAGNNVGGTVSILIDTVACIDDSPAGEKRTRGS